MPEALFEAAREHGVDVTGENCLGHRSYVELTDSDDGLFKLNVPVDQPQANQAFDTDGAVEALRRRLGFSKGAARAFFPVRE